MFKLGDEKEQMMMVMRNSEILEFNLQQQHHSSSSKQNHLFNNGFSEEDTKFHHYGLWLDSKRSRLPDSHYRNKNVDDGFGLCENLYQMHISDEERNVDVVSSGGPIRNNSFGFGFGDVSSGEKYQGFNNGTLLGGYQKADSFGSYSIGYNQSNDLSSLPSWHDHNQRNYLLEQRMEQGGGTRGLDNSGILSQTTRPYIANPFDSFTSPRFLHTKIPLDNNVVEDHSLIIQGRGFKYDIDNNNNKGLDSFKYRKNKCIKEIAMQNLQDKSSKLNKLHGENVTLMPYSLVEFQGCIYYMAKDQKGCRFLQRIFDEGNCLDVQLIFNEVIDNIVELMMDPFGNYLVQKLLDVCTEEQRLQIVLTVTKESGQLVRISLNTYGTRVVQKLIETLKSRQQISLIKSALKPGILDLIKDLNGNHVLQRCLQCLDNEDNKIIFDAAAKFCVDIASHRHGCCVLQRCIAHFNGQHRDKLITQISRNGLLLAQDPFGNYVVQYIIELKVPSAAGNLLSQFKGHYVHLSMQKFSSHVVEKCLKHFPESRSAISRELTSVVHFEQLLQDPYANYVIQSALAVTKGPPHANLVEAVRPHTILRTSPYCKRIFTRNLLKK